MEQHRAPATPSGPSLNVSLIRRVRDRGREDLAELLAAGRISAGEAFLRLHARR
jgi:hypothetical protein